MTALGSHYQRVVDGVGRQWGPLLASLGVSLSTLTSTTGGMQQRHHVHVSGALGCENNSIFVALWCWWVQRTAWRRQQLKLDSVLVLMGNAVHGRPATTRAMSHITCLAHSTDLCGMHCTRMIHQSDDLAPDTRGIASACCQTALRRRHHA
jgi:hypothetical protein